MASKNTITNASVSEIIYRSKDYYTPEGWKELQKLYAIIEKAVAGFTESEKALLYKGLNYMGDETLFMFAHLLEADKED